ncbi:Putative oxidoreductase YdbC (plasmid) [Streptomyces sp. YIM 121038]|uniref:aldo/keto reductase n=1 Tax=Streptomyces sp. YIM 121038 TaxID=2136401 RepID=UPI0011107CE5|nr:aldo/keto reductase [Streptomyces sp. YIM 121038]QCX82251.1 Putative oxidoreductase YdbC [Streptomyces sp. YIM 121038]
MSAAPPAGTLTLAGKTVSRLGLGTMRLTGPGTWGDPPDRDTALSVLRQAVHTYGITHLDTADAYGPHTVEHLIRDALYPYPQDLLIATKVGMLRPAPSVWAPHGHPTYLRAAVEASLRRLSVDQLDLCYLHRIDPEVPLADQLGTLQALQQEGKIAHIGLSKITPEMARLAAKEIPVAAVQNALNINDRHDPLLEVCRDHAIPYVAYRPLDAGYLTHGPGLEAALDWLLRLGPHIAPIPGTSNPHHLTQLVTAAGTWP